MEHTLEELEQERKRGIPLQLLEDELMRARCKKKIVCMLGTEQTAEKIWTFFKYRGFVVDGKAMASLPVLRSKARLEILLEEARRAIVNAAKQGQVCLIHLGSCIPPFNDKICAYANYFPPEVFHFGQLKGSVLNKLYREEDKEAGQCVVRDGFQVVVNLALDGDFSMEMSSMQKAEVQEKIPGFEGFYILRCRG